MQNVTEQEVIDYAREKHHLPSAFAKNWFDYWTRHNWITTNGKAILNWRVKFDWWALDHKSSLILTEATPPPPARPSAAEIRALQLQRQHEERERAERLYRAQQADPAAQAEIAAIQERLFRRFSK